jgi:photosystem II stability/assembly factor-like uncharacterized protein
MRTHLVRLALAIVLLCPSASAQWVQTNGPFIGGTGNVGIYAIAVRGPELFVGAGFNVGGPKYGSDSLFIFRSSDNGESWVRLVEVKAHLIASVGSDVFAAHDRGLIRSTDSGASWTAADSGFVGPYRYVMSLVVAGPNLFAGTDGGVYRSTDGGTIWAEVNTGLTFTYVNALAVSGSNLFAGTGGGGVFLSTNSGTSWTKASTGLLEDPNGCDVLALAVAGTNIFAGLSGGGVFLSTNNGASWTAVNDGLPKIDSTYASITSFAARGQNLFAGTYGTGVFLSTNSGKSWQSVNMDLDQRYVLGLNDTYVFVGNFNTGMVYGPRGMGVWRRRLSEVITSVDRTTNESASAFQLQQNYPNPFNPSTTIKFELPRASEVILSVYDVLGRVVSVLLHDRMEAGVHEVKYDGSNLASGVYFYRLHAADFVSTKRMLALK